MKIKEIFTFMDVCNIGRIDAYEFLTPLSLVTKGDFEYFWDLVVQNFGVEERDFISSDEFWYFIDSLFRGLGKLLIRKEDLQKVQNLNEQVNKQNRNENWNMKACNWRLDCRDVGKLEEQLFKGKDFVKANELKENSKNLKGPDLMAFFKYVHEIGSSAITQIVQIP